MKYLFASLLICLSVSANAQQHHFMYIQADNRQPFYIKLDKKILSSSGSGYLIIPQLLDSSYEFSIGFPKNEWPEQKVTCSINKKDVGYLLKNFGEKGWGLFNFQTMDLVMAETKTNLDNSLATVKNDDPFTNALANVVNDPAIKMVDEPGDDSAAEAAVVKKAPVKKGVKAVAGNKGRISKILSKRNAEGLKMVYVDKMDAVADTINIVIPIVTTIAKTQPLKPNTTTIAVVKSSKPAKLVTANKKPAKKTPVAKTDIAKVDNKTEIAKADDKTDKTKDSVIFTPPVIVTDDPKVAKTIEEIIADIAKADNKQAEPGKDSLLVSQSEKNEEQARKDSVLATDQKKADEDAALKAVIRKANEDAMLVEEKKKADDELALA